jgi:lipid-A-disaccharide synthase
VSGRYPSVFLSAGEESGDQHGAALARELKARIPGVKLIGLGGDRMAREGVELLAGLDRLAILGFGEVARRLPDLLALRRAVHRALEDHSVDLVVPIDYPGFNLPLAGHAHRKGRSVLYYIAPQVWAWKTGRVRKLARWADRVCVVLPFEPEFLAAHGLEATFVGHPLLDAPRPPPGGESNTLGLFPGSRLQEIRRMLPVFLSAAEQVAERRPGLRVMVARAPGVPMDTYRGCEGLLADPEDVVRLSRAAIAKSGTITLQLALSGVPMMVGYQIHPVTYRVMSRIVKVEHFSLVNLVAARPVVREFIQDALSAEALALEAGRLMDEGPYREEMVAGLGEVRARLGQPGAAGRVAEQCVELLEARVPSS